MHMIALGFLLSSATMAAEHVPSADELAVHKALSARHFDGDCARIEALAKAPVQTLQNIVEHASAPPWAPMRAALCLTLNHAAEIQPDLERWVSDPELVGLGIQTLNKLDSLPEPIALAVAQKALAEGPERLEARTRLERSALAPVQTLLVTP